MEQTLKQDEVLPAVLCARPVREASDTVEPGAIEEGQTAGVVGVHFCVDGPQHEGEFGMAKCDVQCAPSDTASPRVRRHQNADAGPQVAGLEFIQVHRPHHLTTVLDDPPELSGSVQVLVPATEGIECSAGVRCGSPGHRPVFGFILPVEDHVDIRRLDCTESRRAIVKQIGREGHERSKIGGQSGSGITLILAVSG